MIYYWTDARQRGIYLLSARMGYKNLKTTEKSSYVIPKVVAVAQTGFHKGGRN